MLIGSLAFLTMVGSGLAALPEQPSWSAVGADEAASIRGAACTAGVGGNVQYCQTGTSHTKGFLCTGTQGLGVLTGSSSAAGTTHEEYIPNCPCGATNQKIVRSCSGTTTP
jgi:hypothetical protein